MCSVCAVACIVRTCCCGSPSHMLACRRCLPRPHLLTLSQLPAPLWQLEPMHSNVTTSTVARSAPLWLPAEQQHSTTSLPNVQSGGSGPAGSGSRLSPPQASSELPGGAGTDSPAFSSKELSALLSDWEIKPEGKTAAGAG